MAPIKPTGKKATSKKADTSTKKPPFKKVPPSDKKATTTPHFWYSPDDSCLVSSTIAKVKVRGTPKTLERHRTTKTAGGSFRFYNPCKKEQVSFLTAVEEAFQSVQYPMAMVHPAIKETKPSCWSVSCRFYFPRPQSHFSLNTRNQQVPLATAPKFMPFAPDVDNMIKFVLDALNGFVYLDDKQVVDVRAVKLYQNNVSDQGSIIMKFEKLV
jgi:Holliday junction resolvase RusA-like endonuclease